MITTEPTEREFTGIYILHDEHGQIGANFPQNKQGDFMEIISFQTEPLHLDKAGWIEIKTDPDGDSHYYKTISIKDRASLIQAFNDVKDDESNSLFTAAAIGTSGVKIENNTDDKLYITVSSNISEHLYDQANDRIIFEFTLNEQGQAGDKISFRTRLFDTLYFYVKCDCCCMTQGNINEQCICISGIEGKMDSKTSGDVDFELNRNPAWISFTLFDDQDNKLDRPFTLEIKTIKQEFFREYPDKKHQKQPFYLDMRKDTGGFVQMDYSKVCLQQIINKASPETATTLRTDSQLPDGYQCEIMNPAPRDIKYKSYDRPYSKTTVQMVFAKNNYDQQDPNTYTYTLGSAWDDFTSNTRFQKMQKNGVLPTPILVQSNQDMLNKSKTVDIPLDSNYMKTLKETMESLRDAQDVDSYVKQNVKIELVPDQRFSGPGFLSAEHIKIYSLSNLLQLFYVKVKGPYVNFEQYIGLSGKYTSHAHNPASNATTGAYITRRATQLGILDYLLYNGVLDNLTIYDNITNRQIFVNSNGATPQDDIENPTAQIKQPANLLGLSFSEYWYKMKIDHSHNVKLDLTTSGIYSVSDFIFKVNNTSIISDTSCGKYFDQSASGATVQFNQSSAFDNYCIFSDNIVFYSRDSTQTQFIITPTHLDVVSFNKPDSIALCQLYLENPHGQGLMDPYYYLSNRYNFGFTHQYVPINDLSSKEKVREQLAHIFKWKEGADYPYDIQDTTEGKITFGITTDTVLQQQLSYGLQRLRKVLTCGPLNNSLEFTTLYWPIDKYPFGSIAQMGGNRFIPWRQWNQQLGSYPDELEIMAPTVLAEYYLRKGILTKTAGTYLTYTYSSTSGTVGLYRFGQFPQDRISLQLTQQTSSNFNPPQGVISDSVYIEETNPWFQPAPTPSPDTSVRIIQDTTIDKLKSVLYQIDFKTDYELFTLALTSQDTMRQEINNSRMIWHQLNPQHKYRFDIDLLKVKTYYNNTTQSEHAENDNDKQMVLRLCFK